jgi:hypothetical protein
MIEQFTPIEGMGATVQHWTDRTACTITYVTPTHKTIEMREDKAERTDDNGMSEVQEYKYTPEDGRFFKARLCKDGHWRTIGDHELVAINSRRKYHDFSF